MKLDHIERFHSNVDRMIADTDEAIAGHEEQIRQLKQFRMVLEKTGRENKNPVEQLAEERRAEGASFRPRGNSLQQAMEAADAAELGKPWAAKAS